MARAVDRARPYGGISEKDRRNDRRRRLVSATLDLVGDSGVSAVTIGEVCARASISKRYFYESFESVDDLLASTLDELFAAVSSTIDAAGPPTEDPSDLVSTAVYGAIAAMDDPRTARLYLESAANPALLSTRDAATERFVSQLLARLLGSRSPTVADQLLGHVMVSGTTHVIALWLKGRLPLSRDDLATHLIELGTETAVRVQSGTSRGLGVDQRPTC